MVSSNSSKEGSISGFLFYYLPAAELVEWPRRQKSSPMDSVSMLRKRVQRTWFVSTIANFNFVSSLPSHSSISSPQQQHHVGITVPPQQHQSPTLHVSVGPSWTCPSLPWGLITSLYCEEHIQKLSFYLYETHSAHNILTYSQTHSALTSMKQVF